jgi:hypothetical protein
MQLLYSIDELGSFSPTILRLFASEHIYSYRDDSMFLKSQAEGHPGTVMYN